MTNSTYAYINPHQSFGMSDYKPSNVKSFRKRQRGGLIRGTIIGLIFRWIFCVLILGIVIAIGIIATIVLYVKPPNLAFLGVEEPNNGSTVSAINNALSINFDLQIQVDNPNTFDITFNELYAQLFWGATNISIGYGRVENIDIRSENTTNFRYPFHIVYKASYDPNRQVLGGLLDSCGLTDPNSKPPIDIQYDLDIDVKALSVNIKQTISNSMSVTCPGFSESMLQDAVGDTISVDDLVDELTRNQR
ncbi:hypothetical protein E3P89_01141 [Wallemia ichthyophaga]|uniref:Late embryogenesis abundant protein LEA-2 subgroup domain-containing protein n=1 Tax=Wallemia ichthyophaga TaxID=245174 RepID=A0A4T0HI26_WALIC|nr:hypothetical protein E3P90_01542 [Wallemia ichthyophaga]TIB15636.1 hypothetical protein E3P93_01292 [Wallemia ichthyophaga]TIB24239.1 hypothetical protein E3P89_01141 [Wallemia ichthyophaga]TIB25647.1 hypothetical protein E3P88_01496 [Wallemia ichthyophaga]